MTTITFLEIKLSGRKSCKCVGCGKRLTRSTTLVETSNPWNTNVKGQRKTHDEILASLQVKLATWKNVEELCKTCKCTPR